MARHVDRRERLARRAAGGDVEAARELVRLLEATPSPKGASKRGEHDPEHVRRAGEMLLGWSGIEPGDRKALDEFFSMVRHSTIPEAAADVGFSITGGSDDEDDENDEDDEDDEDEGDEEACRRLCVPGEGPICNDRSAGWTCTLPPGHAGVHVACGMIEHEGEHGLETWE